MDYLKDEKKNNDEQNGVGLEPMNNEQNREEEDKKNLKPNVFKKDFINSHIATDRLIKETDPSLLDLKRMN